MEVMPQSMKEETHVTGENSHSSSQTDVMMALSLLFQSQIMALDLQLLGS